MPHPRSYCSGRLRPPCRCGNIGVWSRVNLIRRYRTHLLWRCSTPVYPVEQASGIVGRKATDKRPAALSQKEPVVGFKVVKHADGESNSKAASILSRYWASVCRKTGCAQMLMRFGHICPPNPPLQDAHGAPFQAAIIPFDFTSIPEDSGVALFAQVSLFPLSSG